MCHRRIKDLSSQCMWLRPISCWKICEYHSHPQVYCKKFEYSSAFPSEIYYCNIILSQIYWLLCMLPNIFSRRPPLWNSVRMDSNAQSSPTLLTFLQDEVCLKWSSQGFSNLPWCRCTHHHMEKRVEITLNLPYRCRGLPQSPPGECQCCVLWFHQVWTRCKVWSFRESIHLPWPAVWLRVIM